MTVREPEDLDHLTLPAGDAATLIDVSRRRLEQLVTDRWIPRPKQRGLDSLVGVVQGYIRFRLDRLQAPSAAAVELNNSRRREVELRIAERDARLIDVEEHDHALADIVAVLREHVAALPGRFDDPDLRARIEVELEAIFAETHARLAETSARLRATGRALPDDAS